MSKSIRSSDLVRTIDALTREIQSLERSLLSTRTVWGLVGSDGSITGGSGFDVSYTSTGAYAVSFHTAFSSAPSVQITAAMDSTRLGVVVSPTANGFTAKMIIAPTASYSDTAFHFHAVGPR